MILDQQARHFIEYLIQAIFATVTKKGGRLGVRFAYVTPNADVLGCLFKRLLDKPLADILH